MEQEHLPSKQVAKRHRRIHSKSTAGAAQISILRVLVPLWGAHAPQESTQKHRAGGSVVQVVDPNGWTGKRSECCNSKRRCMSARGVGHKTCQHGTTSRSSGMGPWVRAG
eukprot:scaffold174622_cov19-Tisochrysis_lutea.AAC.2